jgi:hypothetical protein
MNHLPASDVAHAPTRAASTIVSTPQMIRVFLAASLFATLWTFTPPADPHFRLCGFYWLTGHPCALCGMTRAMFAMAKGRFAEAIGFNALAPLGFAMMFALFWSSKIPGRIWSASAAILAVYGICRFFVTQ